MKHPQDWPYGGYAEIQSPRQRYALLDYEELKEILNFKTIEELAEAYRGCVDDTIIKGNHKRDGKWTESIAVGSELFVSTTKDQLGIKAKGRDVFGTEGSYELREDPGHYKQFFEHEKADVSPENAYYWIDRF